MRLPTEKNPVVEERVRIQIEDDPSYSEIEAVLKLSVFGPATASDIEPSRFRLDGKLRCTVTSTCARCLAPASAPVTSRWRDLVDLDAMTLEDAEGGSEPEVGLFSRPTAETADFSEEVRQRAILATPQIVYCRSDCKGLCSACGRDLNRGECGCDRESRGGPFEALRSFLPKDGPGRD